MEADEVRRRTPAGRGPCGGVPGHPFRVLSMEVRQITVDPLSLVSVLLHTTCNGLALSQATGSFVSNDGQDYLITNGHVLTGRTPQTNEPVACESARPLHVVWRSTLT